MSIEEWFPDLDVDLGLFSGGVDEDFEEVYEAYENFYRQANTPNGRAGTRMSAGQDFMDAVMDYYDVDKEEANAGIGMGLFLNADGEYQPNPLEEKMDEEELYRYLEGNL